VVCGDAYMQQQSVLCIYYVVCRWCTDLDIGTYIFLHTFAVKNVGISYVFSVGELCV